jgi:hypothetical protein
MDLVMKHPGFVSTPLGISPTEDSKTRWQKPHLDLKIDCWASALAMNRLLRWARSGISQAAWVATTPPENLFYAEIISSLAGLVNPFT